MTSSDNSPSAQPGNLFAQILQNHGAYRETSNKTNDDVRYTQDL